MIEVGLRVTFTCKCGCRSIYTSDKEYDIDLSLVHQAYADGWDYGGNKEFICPFCTIDKNKK